MRSNFTYLKRGRNVFGSAALSIALLLTSMISVAADPKVISVSPADGTLGVSVTTQVVVIFNENMNPATINSSTFELRSNGNNVVPATIVYEAALRKATLTPIGVLSNSTSYKVTVAGGNNGVRDIAGNKMKGNFQSSFTTIVAVDNVAPTVKNVEPAHGSRGVSLNTEVSVKFSEDMNPASITTSTFELRDGANQVVPATISYHVPSKKATLKPAGALANSTLYSAKVKGGSSGVTDLSGNALASDYNWSFSTPYTIFQPATVPATPVITDQPLEVGVKFTTTQNGQILGLRFYKGAGNDGTHTGHLWTSNGTMLAEATFINESTSGWQQVLFSAPVNILAGQVYVASYFSSLGKYGFTNGYFTSSVVNGPIRALADGEAGGNGVYSYSGASAFPTSSFNATNYFVDVVFVPATNNRMIVSGINSLMPVLSQGTAAVNKTTLQKDAKVRGTSTLTLRVDALPNPTAGYFNIVINSNSLSPASVRVHDMSGKLVYQGFSADRSLQIGQNWKAGVYFAEITQGAERRVLKLIKGK